MKTNKTQNKRKKPNRGETRKNKDMGNKSMTSTSESTVLRSRKSRIAKILNAIFPGKNKGKNKNKSTSNSVTNNSSPNKTISTLSLQLNATKLAQDNNINTIEDNNTNAPLTFSTFGKESKNSDQNIAKDNARRSPSPPPPIRASSLRKSSSAPTLQTNSIKLAQDDNTSASLIISTTSDKN